MAGYADVLVIRHPIPGAVQVMSYCGQIYMWLMYQNVCLYSNHTHFCPLFVFENHHLLAVREDSL